LIAGFSRFINVSDFDARPVDALKRIYIGYGVPFAKNKCIGKTLRSETPLLGCEYSVDVYRENAGKCQRT